MKKNRTKPNVITIDTIITRTNPMFLDYFFKVMDWARENNIYLHLVASAFSYNTKKYTWEIDKDDATIFLLTWNIDN